MSLVKDVETAIVADLNAHAFDLAFTAARKVAPEWTLEELETLRVSVVAKSRDDKPASRGQDDVIVAVDIAVQKRLDADDVMGDFDALLDLVESLADFLSRRAQAGAAWMDTTNDPIYSPEHYRQWAVFTSVLTVSYRLGRTPAMTAATATAS